MAVKKAPKQYPVYVGELEYPYRSMLMSHMASPDIETLHRMADMIGVNRRHFQNKPRHPHYDICKAKKKQAIKFGAVEISDREIIRLCYLINVNTSKGWKDYIKSLKA